jgi:DNA-damage-inducible protein D
LKHYSIFKKQNSIMETDKAMSPFEGKEIRKIWHNEEWWFSIVDVIGILTDSEKPSQYWHNMKKRDSQLSPICLKLKLKGQDGKTYPSDCAHTEGVFRILMSVPSPKVEPFKLWLAEQGKRAIDETENPELSLNRLTEIYKAKGHDDVWIGNRLKTIGIRKELTDEWKVKNMPF